MRRRSVRTLWRFSFAPSTADLDQVAIDGDLIQQLLVVQMKNGTVRLPRYPSPTECRALYRKNLVKIGSDTDLKRRKDKLDSTVWVAPCFYGIASGYTVWSSLKSTTYKKLRFAFGHVHNRAKAHGNKEYRFLLTFYCAPKRGLGNLQSGDFIFVLPAVQPDTHCGFL